MTSEIRANTLKNRVGLGTVSFTNTGPVVSGIVTIANSTTEGVTLEDNAGVGNSLKITTPTGYVSVGAGNATFAHLQTDRGIFYFNRRISVDEGIISSYDEDLVLQSPMNTNRVTINKTTGLVSIVNDLDVDGHTNLDNVSIAGVTTATETIRIQGDNKYLTVGASNQIGVVHTGGEAFITNSTGHLTHRCDVHKWENFAGSSEYVRIKSDGYFGVGTNNPQNKFHVNGLNTVARFQSTGSYVDLKLQNSSSQLGFIQYAGTELRFFANSGSTPTIYIPNTKFGVNTVPTTTVHIKDTLPEIRLKCSDDNLDQGDYIGRLSFETTDPTNPSGAGVVSHIEAYSANGNGADYTTSIFNRAGSGGGETMIRLGNALGHIRFYTHPSGAAEERLRIDSSGRVLIGTATNRLGEQLHVLGSGIVTSSAENTNMMIFGTFGSSDAIIGSFNSIPLLFRTGNTERLRITAAGTAEFHGGEGGTDHIAVDSEGGGAQIYISNFQGVTDTGDTTRLGVGKNDNALIFMNASGSQVQNFAIGNTDAVPLVFSTNNKKRLEITGSGITKIHDNQGTYTNTVQSHTSEAGYITHYTARTTYGGADLYRRMLDIASIGGAPHGSSIRFLTSNNDNNINGVERMRIMDDGGVFIGTKTHTQRYSHAESPALLTVQNGARVTTSSSTYAAPKGGFMDYARYELESKLIDISNSALGLVQARNGQPLTINNSRSGWSYFSNLPNYLLGHPATDNINNTNFTLTLYANMTVFLLRTHEWNAVDLTNWNLIESNTSIGPASGNTRLYVKSIAAGSYSFDNDSAMYFFVL